MMVEWMDERMAGLKAGLKAVGKAFWKVVQMAQKRVVCSVGWMAMTVAAQTVVY